MLLINCIKSFLLHCKVCFYLSGRYSLRWRRQQTWERPLPWTGAVAPETEQPGCTNVTARLHKQYSRAAWLHSRGAKSVYFSFIFYRECQ